MNEVLTHDKYDCSMCVVRGIIRETKYHTPKQNELKVEELYVKEIMDLQESEVHLINDEIGLHKMKTFDENQQAVTLHCYIPPYLDCFIFYSKNGEIKTNIVHTIYDTGFEKIV